MPCVLLPIIDEQGMPSDMGRMFRELQKVPPLV